MQVLKCAVHAVWHYSNKNLCVTVATFHDMRCGLNTTSKQDDDMFTADSCLLGHDCKEPQAAVGGIEMCCTRCMTVSMFHGMHCGQLAQRHKLREHTKMVILFLLDRTWLWGNPRNSWRCCGEAPSPLATLQMSSPTTSLQVCLPIIVYSRLLARHALCVLGLYSNLHMWLTVAKSTHSDVSHYQVRSAAISVSPTKMSTNVSAAWPVNFRAQPPKVI